VTGPYVPPDIPPNTDLYIYRPVTDFHEDAGMGVPVVDSEYKQIWISQP
jgi:hypothetical protein